MSPTATITAEDRQILDQVRRQYQQDANLKLNDAITKASQGKSSSTASTVLPQAINFFAKHMTPSSDFDSVTQPEMRQQVLNAVYAHTLWVEQSGSGR